MTTRSKTKPLRTVRAIPYNDPYGDPLFVIATDHGSFYCRVGDGSEIIRKPSLEQLFSALARRAKRGSLA